MITRHITTAKLIIPRLQILLRVITSNILRNKIINPIIHIYLEANVLFFQMNTIFQT